MSARPLVVGFWIDPFEALRPGHDTSLELMLGCLERGHRVVCFEQRDVSVRGAQPVAALREVTLATSAGRLACGPRQAPTPLQSLDAVWLRRDPPVDATFIHVTLMLEPLTHPLLINRPASLRDCNEKLYALDFADLGPETVVSSDPAELLAALERFGGRAVLKPLDGCGGAGIELLEGLGASTRASLEAATSAGQRPTLVQRFLEASREGDKRILLLDGRPLGAVLRQPRPGEFRCNFAQGGKGVATTVTPRERLICERLAPDLLRRGLHFVGIDVIGEHLTEINVTSPTGLVEINALDGKRLELDVVRWLEANAPRSLSA
ncbi:MAG: glutathione synthase [Archangium sp.]|nr:glutathione synthase [Archangium sp.]